MLVNESWQRCAAKYTIKIDGVLYWKKISTKIGLIAHNIIKTNKKRLFEIMKKHDRITGLIDHIYTGLGFNISPRT